MTDSSPHVTRRRLLGSVATVAGASAATGAGTMAYFSDTSTSSGNVVQAGTLDLTFGQSQTVPFLDETGITPPDSGSETLDLVNDGSIDGALEVDISGIQSTGELENYLEIEVRIGGQPFLSRQSVSNLSTPPIAVVETQDNVVIQGGGNQMSFTLEWWLPESTKNKAKGDSVSLDFTFRLTQT